jgi:hypothetical protein
MAITVKAQKKALDPKFTLASPKAYVAYTVDFAVGIAMDVP